MAAGVKMDVPSLMCDSPICRLCGEENHNGTLIFSDDPDKEDISRTINKYLPIKVEKDEPFPNSLCPGCNIQIEATKSFFDLIIAGQEKLRGLHSREVEARKRQEKQKREFEDVLKVVNPNSSMQTYSVQADDNGEKIYIQVLTDGPLFSPDHEMSLRVEGLEKPKRKKGRPLKASQNPPPEPEPIVEVPNKEAEEETEELDGKKKRRIKRPVRYSELIQGKELERLFKEQGVIDEEDYVKSEENDTERHDKTASETNEVIGHMEGKDGENLGQLVMVKGGSKLRLKCKNGTGNSSPKKKEKYKCDLCGRSFLHLSRLEIHKSFHKNIKYQCGTSDCDKSFETKTALDEHQKESEHTGSSLIECLENYGQVQLLPQTNPENCTLPQTEDEVKTSNESKIMCDICNKTFTCQRNFDVHMKAVHENQKPYACDKCDKKFPYLNSLKSHMLTHNVKTYPCEFCDKVFQHPSSLVYHGEAEHNNGRKFVCNKCKKEFKHKQLLLRHQIVHTNERPHTCTYCGRSFKRRVNLLTHMPTHTGVKKYCCSLCGQSFSHKTSLTLHLRWHKGQKPFECDVCSKKFSQRGNLAEHKRIHTGEKPFCCNFCGRRFTTSSQFKLHMKRHSGERPWKCEYCSKTFLHKDTWKSHMRRHRNERPYQCQQCFRGFTEQWSLKKHERLHTGEKPHKCEICGKAFADTSNLAKHRKVHAKDKTAIKNDPSNVINVSISGNGQQDSSDILYVTYEQCSPTDQGTLVHIVDTMNETSGGKNDAFYNTAISKVVEENPADPMDIQLQQLVDNDGNAISLTTDDGQQIKIVSTVVDDEQSIIQGLLPDGTLIPINLAVQDGKPVAAEIEPKKNIVDIKENILLLPHTTQQMDDIKQDLGEQKLQFLSEDGQTVCFISSFNDGNFIGMQ